MRSLFLKIFLWFWVAMTAVAGVFVVSLMVTDSGYPPPWQALADQAL